FRFASWSTSIQAQAAPQPPYSAILSPTNGLLLDSLAPVEVKGFAHAEAGLSTITIYANDQVIYTASPGGATAADFSTSWTPAAPGSYLLSVFAEDVDGEQQAET